jgi:transcriptional regulator with GAF, ATPase, and Fis domain
MPARTTLPSIRTGLTTTQLSPLPRSTVERLTGQMTASLHLEEVLTLLTQGLVEELDAALACIWLPGPGDRCAACAQATACADRTRCLHLQASAGLFTDLQGEYQRVPLNTLTIGLIAQGCGLMVTNDVLNDNRLPNKPWLRAQNLQSFAGYPLRFREELLGVVAMFSRQLLTPEVCDRLAFFAHHAAIAIKNAQLFAEVEHLTNRLQAENVYLQEAIQVEHTFEDLLGGSRALKTVLRRVEQVAITDATVLVLGETGTGKELVARAIHRLSPRHARPLVKVNCAALPPTLIESALFGHEKGAFTGAVAQQIGRFELAHRGTIFLDEIGDLPLALQAKLLRVLQDGEFERVGGTRTLQSEARVIAATHRDLSTAVPLGKFREDLYYRLQGFPLTLPPLRERREDIPMLVHHFVRKYATKFGKAIDTIPRQVLETLQAYPWPGNVRELEHVIERAVILARDTTLALDDFSPAFPSPDGRATRALTLADVERQHIRRVLQETHGRIEGPRGAAVWLGLHPATLRSRMQRLGITKPRRRY